MSALHEQAAIPVADPKAFGAVQSAIQTSFSSPKIKDFLKSVERSGFRIRDFESVLRRGLLGASTAAEYDKLVPGNQGMIREFYLASLEKVALELRAHFRKIYAYY